MKKAAFLDIDGTLLHGFSTHHFIYFLNKKGHFDFASIKEFQEVDKNLKRYQDYPTWSHETDDQIKKLFSGQQKYFFKKYLVEFENNVKSNLYHYSGSLVNFLEEMGFEIFLITGALDFLAEKVAQILSISLSNVIAEELAEKDGKYLPEIKPYFGILNGTKKKALLELGKKFDLKKSVAFGDTESDFEMLNEISQGFLMSDSKTPEKLKKESTESGIILINKDKPLNEILDVVKSNLP